MLCTRPFFRFLVVNIIIFGHRNRLSLTHIQLRRHNSSRKAELSTASGWVSQQHRQRAAAPTKAVSRKFGTTSIGSTITHLAVPLAGRYQSNIILKTSTVLSITIHHSCKGRQKLSFCFSTRLSTWLSPTSFRFVQLPSLFHNHVFFGGPRHTHMVSPFFLLSCRIWLEVTFGEWWAKPPCKYCCTL